MARAPKIDVTDSERQVLNALWDLGATSIRPLLERLRADGKEWAYTTLHTLLNRLVKKGYAQADRDGLAHVYRATLTREGVLQRGLKDLARRWCDGTTRPLLVELLEQDEFEPEDIDYFRRLLSAKARHGKAKGKQR